MDKALLVGFACPRTKEAGGLETDGQREQALPLCEWLSDGFLAMAKLKGVSTMVEKAEED